jgi:uncharacterized phiE125 gp8 family phage protein
VALSRTTASSGQQVVLADVKDYLRVTTTADDTWINRDIIPAAVTDAESLTGRALLSQTYTLKLRGFGRGPIVRPYPPLGSVSSVTYVDTNGSTQTWSSSKYTVSAPSGEHAGHATIQPAYSESYPSTRSVVDSVTIVFVAGYGVAADIPLGIKQGIALLCEAIYLSDHGLVERARDRLTPYTVWRPDLRLD